MRLAMIGLGRMGGNMVRRLLRGSHDLVVYESRSRARERVGRIGGDRCAGSGDLCARLSAPRVIWLMVRAPERRWMDTIGRLEPHLASDDIVIDGNSNFRDTMRRATRLRERGIELVDAGPTPRIRDTSGCSH